MGNQTLVPSQIQSVDSYFLELKNFLHFKASLGSTTFMKTAKVVLLDNENDSILMSNTSSLASDSRYLSYMNAPGSTTVGVGGGGGGPTPITVGGPTTPTLPVTTSLAVDSTGSVGQPSPNETLSSSNSVNLSSNTSTASSATITSNTVGVASSSSSSGAPMASVHLSSNMRNSQRYQQLREQQQQVVVKIFPRYDLSIRLDLYSKRVREIKNIIYSRYGMCTNCLPFHEFIITDKAAFLMRQYVKYNLYDRLSTRPFLTMIEKKWIAFQLLCAINEIHSLQIVHGDMKTENVLVNSFLWVSLADLASYKPVYLSKNHPSADFNYYFDTSRRRTCCLAPERLDSPSSNSASTRPAQSGPATDDMNMMSELMPPDPNDFRPSMDIFSLGCVLAELFMERPLFDFAQLLAYRDGKYDPSGELVNEIGDPNVLEMIFSMLSLDPNQRKTANEYLQQQNDKAFPSYFVYLKNYLSRFINPRLSADEIVVKLRNDLPLLLKNFKLNLNEKAAASAEKSAVNEAFLILLSLLLSCVRKIKFSENKLIAVDLMATFGKFLDDSIILDRILPYYLCLLDNDQQPRQPPMVKSHVVYALNDCLSSVYKIDVQNLNIFPELVFDCLEKLSKDESYLVRSAVAKTISNFALTSLRYLDQVFITRRSFLNISQQQLNNTASNSNNNLSHDATATTTTTSVDGAESRQLFSQKFANYDKEYEYYQHRITEIVMHLMTDTSNVQTSTVGASSSSSSSSNAVKEALIRSDISKLCSFFTRHKTSEFLLPHMITILNEKTDWSVRAAFFDALCPVLTCIGWESVEIVKSLLEQGLRDSEEFVIYKTLLSLCRMVEIGLLDKQQIVYFLSLHIAPLLCHPSLWIRHAAVYFITTVCRRNDGVGLNTADVLCTVAPLLSKFLQRRDLLNYDREEILFSCLKKPIERAVYDCIAADMRSDQLFTYLAQRSEIRCLNIFNNQNYLPGYIDCNDANVQEFFDKLCKLGFVEEDEDKLLQMKDFMDKTRISRLNSSLHNTDLTESNNSTTSILNPWSSGVGGGGRENYTLKDGYINILRDKFQRCNVELLNTKINHHHYAIGSGNSSEVNSGSFDPTRRAVSKVDSLATNPSGGGSDYNTEWRLMFGKTNQADESKTISSSSSSSSTLKRLSSTADFSAVSRGPIASGSSVLNPTSAGRFVDCTSEVEKYINRAKFMYDDHRLKHTRALLRQKEQINSSISSNMLSLSTSMGKWKPRGYLVFHSNEHTKEINRLSRNSDSTYFSTCSTAEACVKIWSTENLLDARSGFYKSVFTYDRTSSSSSSSSTSSTQETGAGSFRPCCTSFRNKNSLAILCEDFKFYEIDFNHEHTQYRRYSNDRLFRLNACKMHSSLNGLNGFNKTIFYYLNRSNKIATPTQDGGKCSARACYCLNNYPVEMICVDDTSSSWTCAATNVYDYYLGSRASPVKGLFCYSTSNGDFSCIDMRSRSKAFDVRRDLRRGYITTMITDPWYTWIGMGTSNGTIEVYDFRFMVPVQSFEHRSKTPVARMCNHPASKNRLIASYQGNNEISIWNMERRAMSTSSPGNGSSSSDAEFVFWGVQSVPPLCQSNMSNAYISGLVSVSAGDEHGTNGLICASSDMKMRYVDLTDPSKDSYVISSAFNFQQNSKLSNDLSSATTAAAGTLRQNEFATSILNQNVSYEMRQIEGTRVLLELDQQNGSTSAAGQMSGAATSSPLNHNTPALFHQSYFTHHQDAISDLIVCYNPATNKNQPLIVASARDGTLKIWR